MAIQRLPIRLYDTIVYPPATSLTVKKIGATGGIDNAQYKNFTWQELSQQKNVTISGCRVAHNMQFTQSSTESLKYRQMYFENFSLIKIWVKETEYAHYSLANLLPYKLNYVDADVNSIKEEYSIFAFQEDLKVPETGAIKCEFVPAEGLTTAADANTNPLLPGLDLTNDRGFYIYIEFFGIQEREVPDAN